MTRRLWLPRLNRQLLLRLTRRLSPQRRPVTVPVLVVLLVATVLASACRAGGSAKSGGTSPAASPPTGLPGGGGETTPPSGTPGPTGSPGTPGPTSASALKPSVKPTIKAPPIREVPGDCPYISNATVQEIEGDRVGRSALLTATPVGCRFYFQYDDTAIVTEITIRTYPSATAAFNAMVLSAKGHPEVVSDADIGAGAVAVRAPLQGTATWQCTFAKGVHVVTVHTRQPDPSFNARSLARQVATKL